MWVAIISGYHWQTVVGKDPHNHMKCSENIPSDKNTNSQLPMLSKTEMKCIRFKLFKLCNLMTILHTSFTQPVVYINLS